MRKLSKDFVPASTRLTRILGLGLLFLSASCAKFPSSQNNFITKRLVFTVKFAGDVHVTPVPYIYIIPLRLSTVSNPTDLGPIPVTSFGGNGFVAGHCTHYIIYDPQATVNPYQIWRFSDDNLINRSQTGVAINILDPRNSGKPNTLQFEIDMSQLVATADVDTILSIQANILAMDKLALSNSGHIWDALGDGRILSQDNTSFLFTLRNSRKFTNATTQVEPPDPDVRGNYDPALDIVDWTIDVRLQQ